MARRTQADYDEAESMRRKARRYADAKEAQMAEKAARRAARRKAADARSVVENWLLVWAVLSIGVSLYVVIGCAFQGFLVAVVGICVTAAYWYVFLRVAKAAEAREKRRREGRSPKTP